MLPLDNTGEAAITPDRQKLFPLVDALLRRYYTGLSLSSRPPTLDAYLKTVVTPTLEAQRQGGCLAVKFEAAYLRALDFAEVPVATAGAVYARYAGGGTPAHADYKALQDYLFRYIAREAGRLGMAVHIHSFEGAGNFFVTSGADPLLLEPVFNDPALRNTKFVVVHGGGIFAGHAGAMLWKPNVFVDTSLMALVYPVDQLSGIVRGWIEQFPEKVLFATDASPGGPDLGWEVTAWIGATHVRAALVQALTAMMRDGEISRARAQEIATMVLRTNAARLYALDLR
jgi:predicted TIM-barrel fold metal-dependent hydrolase